jgi:hypothetical protein
VHGESIVAQEVRQAGAEDGIVVDKQNRGAFS